MRVESGTARTKCGNQTFWEDEITAMVEETDAGQRIIQRTTCRREQTKAKGTAWECVADAHHSLGLCTVHQNTWFST